MFIFFAENRANYNKGQIFPFVIAIIVVIVIMAMITANLGKLAIFKTDVSNAADAGSLGAASVLSGFLLQLGLESDAWCANGIVLIARMAQIFIWGRDDIHVPGISLSQLLGSGGNDTAQGNLNRFPNDLSAAIKLYIPYMIGFQFSLTKANKNGIITWSSAKQKALSDAFGNAGVDEGLAPSNKFKNNPLSLIPSSITYDLYLNEYMSHERNQTGFARFMSHPETGYSKNLGEIGPNHKSPTRVTSGYGWSQNEDESFRGSFPGSNIYEIFGRSLYDNYVEVKVSGRSDYPIKTLTWSDLGLIPFTLAILVYWGAYSKYVRAGQCTGWWGKILCLIYAGVVSGYYAGVIATLPIGYTFPGRAQGMKKYADKAPITLRVTRYKKDTDMSMWKFQYGHIISGAKGHAYVDHGSTIEPAILNPAQPAAGDPGGWFRTSIHLFETELVDGSVY